MLICVYGLQTVRGEGVAGTAGARQETSRVREPEVPITEPDRV